MAEAQQNSGQMVASGAVAQLARRYAKAIYDLADEQKVLDAVASDIRALQGLWRDDAAFHAVTVDPRLKRDQLLAVTKALAAKAGFHTITANALQFLAQRRRLSILPALTDRFLADLAARRGEHSAEVVSAQPLNAAQMQQLADKLATLAGGKVNLVTREDHSLLGGFVVRMGSRMIDTSIKSKLIRLERQLRTTQLSIVSSHKGAA